VKRTSEDGKETEVEEEEAMPDDVDMRDQEQIITKAARHVEMARKQQEFFNSKKDRAKHDRQRNLPQKERLYCSVADFAQNMNIPNFSAKQPGATYYFLPLNVCPLGWLIAVRNHPR
jgi:hypothetical protein